jgi:hypothetical protein
MMMRKAPKKYSARNVENMPSRVTPAISSALVPEEIPKLPQPRARYRTTSLFHAFHAL